MKVTQLYTYPIKSLRPCPVSSSALLTSHGFPHDRTFMLLKRDSTDPKSHHGLKNMHVPYHPEMTLFLTEIILPSEEKPQGQLRVRYNRLADSQAGGTREEDVLEIPLLPETDSLEIIEVNMHKSPTKAFNMGPEYNTWFTARFGFDVVFAYLGGNKRKVLGSVEPNAHASSPASSSTATDRNGGSWFSSVANMAKSIPLFNSTDNDPESGERITFADVATYLVCTEESLASVSSRLPSPMDIEKFRPNIVVSGADGAWDEDFWGEIEIVTADGRSAKIVLTSNCARCKSINIDFKTGAPGADESGEVLKKMQSDRRVDPGSRYSPIFGRYGFLVRGEREGVRIMVGDEVKVSRRNGERTVFEWPGLGTPLKLEERRALEGRVGFS